MKLRGIVSIMLMAVFITVAVTGIQLQISPHASPHSYSLPANTPADHAGDGFALRRLHEWGGYTLIILGAVHLIYNRKSLLNYIVKRR